MLTLLLALTAQASDEPTPHVVLHSGPQTSLFDATEVHVATEKGAHRVTTPIGTFDLPAGAKATPEVGQTWLLNDKLWVEVVGSTDDFLEFAVVE
ncbi:MAG: hypothetical protein AAGA48_37990 [Myxococcota bacterium]